MFLCNKLSAEDWNGEFLNVACTKELQNFASTKFFYTQISAFVLKSLTFPKSLQKLV